jgi:alkyl hydroperoxide reductase subunit AhpC
MINKADMAKPEIASTIRNVFIIPPAKKIRLSMQYPVAIGRNGKEVLRDIDALQLGDKKRATVLVDWILGDDVIVPPSVSAEDARKKFAEVREVRLHFVVRQSQDLKFVVK